MSDWLREIIDAWGWTGVTPVQFIDVNAFGSVIFADKERKYWRIIPENLEIVVIANSDESFAALKASKDFLVDWKMERIVSVASKLIGKPKDDCCYCLKVPAVFDGDYTAENIATMSVSELISVSGSLAKQIDGLSDGASVKIEIVE